MRSKTALSSACAVLCLACASVVFWPLPAQSSRKQITQAEPAATVDLVEPDQSLKPLPDESVKMVSRPGFSYSKKNAQILEPSSAVRLKRGQDLVFVVHCTERDSVRLFAFKKKGYNREAKVDTKAIVPIPVYAKLPYARVMGVPVAVIVDTPANGIPFQVTKTGGNTYRIVVKDLKPGEYGFLVSWSFIDANVPNGWNVFDFGVDP